MIIENSYKPELVTSKEETRYVITECYLRGSKLIATDGQMLLALEVTREETDTDGYVTNDALKQARKEGRSKGLTTIALNGSQKLASGIEFPRPNHGNYPQYEQIIPAKDRKEVTIKLSAEFLAKLAEAMGARGGKVEIRAGIDEQGNIKQEPLIISPLDGDEKVLALLMPCRA